MDLFVGFARFVMLVLIFGVIWYVAAAHMAEKKKKQGIKVGGIFSNRGEAGSTVVLVKEVQGDAVVVAYLRLQGVECALGGTMQKMSKSVLLNEFPYKED